MNDLQKRKLRILFMEFSQSYDFLVKEYKEGMTISEYSKLFDLLVDNYAKKAQQLTKGEA